MDDRTAPAPEVETSPIGDRRRYERPQVLGWASAADIVRKSGASPDVPGPNPTRI